MVFASLPIYSSDPLNWPQQQLIISEGDGGCQNNGHHLQPPPPPSDSGGGGGGSGSIKPVYMADRARLAKIPQPEAALKCPRCESTNTKFCYFNNYSLTQPRHFCKTCRRYWTRGGALRNVPVGGGCRRDKRTAGKGSSRSKSPAAAGDSNFSSSSKSSVLPPTTNTDVIMTHFPQQQHLPNFLTHNHYGGLSFGGIQVGGNDLNNNDVEFQMNNISNGFSEQWRLQQFPNFLNGMEAAPATGNMYTFEPEATEPPQNRSRALDQTAVKMEDNINNISTRQGLNLSRNFLGISGDHNQYWGGGGGGSVPAANAIWTELIGGFTNSHSSTRHIL